MNTQEELTKAIETIRGMNIDARNGIPESLFLMVSSLTPIPNVDLLIVNEKNEILLTRRNDDFFQKSWHIPGGCLRLGESFEDRIQSTAINEVGTRIQYNEKPMAVRNVIRGANAMQNHPNERYHNVAILYQCYLPDGFEISNGVLQESDNGYKRWFKKLPKDFMKIQHVYDDILFPWL